MIPMKEFVLIFRKTNNSKNLDDEEEQLMYRKHWQDWFLSLAARQKLVSPVRRWDPKGITVTQGEVLESTVTIEGLIVIEAIDYAEAVEVAKDCPILTVGGIVEILQGK